jgi:hypothetical protein
MVARPSLGSLRLPSKTMPPVKAVSGGPIAWVKVCLKIPMRLFDGCESQPNRKMS